MEKTTKQKGNITELECLLAFEKRGIEVSVPWGENTRYDMIIDIDNKLYKIQCKTSRETKNGSFSFATSSTRLNTRGSFKACYSKEDKDIIFDSIRDGARWVIDNKYTKNTSIGSCAKYIRDACNGIQKYSYGFRWEYV